MESSFRKFVPQHRVAYAEVFVPGVVDLQGDVADADLVQQAAWDYLRRGHLATRVMHQGGDPGHRVVESFIARRNDPDGFTEGAWVVAIQYDAGTWARIESGELTGLSPGGWYETEELQEPDSSLLK